MTLNLDELERLRAGVSPGPYRACGCNNCGLIWVRSGTDDASVAIIAEAYVDGERVATDEERQSNKRYVAALLNAAPRLLAAARERDRLAAELAEAREREARLFDGLREVAAHWCTRNCEDYGCPMPERAEQALTAATGGEGKGET